MSEQDPASADPRQQLAALLTLDFTPTEREAVIERAEQEGDALGSLLAAAVSVEEIDARLASDENVALGEQVAELVAPAPITESFKGFIAGEVRRAHAWRTRVGEAVAPDRLGLVTGGIFDPERARDVEGQAIRGHVFDLLRRYTSVTSSDEASEPDALVPRTGKRPQDFAEAIDHLHAWEADYEETYGENPFEGVDAEAYLAALPRIKKVRPEDEAESGFRRIAQKLHELRDEWAS